MHECHGHIILDGVSYSGAIVRHINGPDRNFIRNSQMEPDIRAAPCAGKPLGLQPKPFTQTQVIYPGRENAESMDNMRVKFFDGSEHRV